MDEDQKGLLYLFERPFEPLKIPRAGNTVLFQQIGDEDEDLVTLFGSSATAMSVPSVESDIMNELPMCKQVQKGIPFSQFNSLHRAAARELTQRFMGPEVADMKMCWNTAAAIKDNVNEGVFIYALSYVIKHNPAFNSRLVPAIYEVFPSMFIPLDTVETCFNQVKSAKYKVLPEKIAIKHDIDFTGTDVNPEHRVAYFREDYGLNSHHWYWHLIFVLNDTKHRDRKGEIFFYMHNQMLSRYDWERLSNSLDRVVPLENWREPIPDGYFPKLTINNSSKTYGNRPDNMTPQSIKNNRQDESLGDVKIFDIDDMERWRDSLFDAIEKGCMIDIRNGEEEELILSDNVDVASGEKRGIDYLGDAFEADSDLSVNYDLYGDLHNWGHVMIAHIHDPQGFHKAQGEPGVIGNSATASRDPAFWRWHKFVDGVFAKYKLTQDPYDDSELSFESVEVESVEVISDTQEGNILETCWTHKTIEASRGLDFGGDPSVMVDLQHLTHRPFTYKIQVTNNQTEPVVVTVRLYMAPKLNEAGETMTFMDQRLLWGEMDKFKTTLDPGSNSLERLSTESSITLPEEHKEQCFRDLEENPPNDDDDKYCGCGWPQHLLLPKGKTDGMDFQIFALVSDYEKDKVEGATCGKRTCSNAVSYCGILDEKFPDVRPMGYPFDRKPNETVCNVDVANATDFANALPNALMTDIKIYFRDTDLNTLMTSNAIVFPS